MLRKKFEDYLTDDVESADVVILNLCAVKKPTEDKGVALARKLIHQNKIVVITGCLAESDPTRISRLVVNAHLLSTQYLLETNVVRLIDEITGAKAPIIKTGLKLDLVYPSERVLRNPFIGIIPIAFGCTNNCAYCIDRRIWGDVRSLPPDLIIREIRRLVERGVREIRITAHDTAAYGLDIGTNLVELLEKITKIDGEYLVRIGMASPNTLARIADDLLPLIKEEERIYKFVHIPVQSGSDRILRLMNRPYTVDEFRDLFFKIRRVLGSDSTIATDVIVAFPTETEEDHRATIRLLEELRPDVVNISRYGDRPGCPSTLLKPKIHSKVAKRRTTEIFKVVQEISLERNKRFIGRILRVLFLEKREASLGRALNNRIVYVDEDVELGEFHDVRITHTTWKSLYGVLTPRD